MKTFLLVFLFLTLGVFALSQRLVWAQDDKQVTSDSKSLVVFYSLSGNTKRVAEAIAGKIGADIFEIKTVEAYPEDLKVMNSLSKKQRAEGPLPELQGPLPNLADVDEVYIGAPVWGHNLPAPLVSYLAKTDFSGKIVVPFWTMGREDGNYFELFSAEIKNGKVAEGYKLAKVRELSDEDIKKDIELWLGERKK